MGDGFKIDNKKVDLLEIQSTSVEEVISEKLKAAYKIVKILGFI